MPAGSASDRPGSVWLEARFAWVDHSLALRAGMGFVLSPLVRRRIGLVVVVRHASGKRQRPARQGLVCSTLCVGRPLASASCWHGFVLAWVRAGMGSCWHVLRAGILFVLASASCWHPFRVGIGGRSAVPLHRRPGSRAWQSSPTSTRWAAAAFEPFFSSSAFGYGFALRTAHALSKRLYYGYVMVPVVMWMQVLSSPGQTFAFSAMIPSLRQDLGLTDVAISSAYAMGTVLAAIPLSWVGPATDRWGLRPATLWTVIALAAACYAGSFVNSWSGLLALFMTLRFLGQGCMSLLSSNALSMWFRQTIGRIGALLSLGSAVAFAFIPGMIQTRVETFGWRSTYRQMAVVVLVTGLPALWWLFRNRPEDLGQFLDNRPPKTEAGRVADDPGMEDESCPEGEHGPDVASRVTRSSRPAKPLASTSSLTFAQATSHRTFYLLAFITSWWAMSGTGVMFYLYPIASGCGLADEQTNRLFVIFGMAMLMGQLGGGVVVDHVRVHVPLGIGAVALAIGLGLVTAAVGQRVPNLHLALQGFAALFGGGQGLLIAVTSAAWVKYYGREALGKIRGTVWCVTVAGSGLGPLWLGFAIERHGDFQPALSWMTFGMAAAALMACWATPPRG